MKKKKEIKNLALTEEEIATNHIVKSNKTYLIVFGIFFLTIILLLVGSLFRTNITPDYPLVFRDANNKLMVITKSGSGKKDITITDANIVYANKDIRYLLYSHNNALFLLDTTSGGEGKKLAEDITKYGFSSDDKTVYYITKSNELHIYNRKNNATSVNPVLTEVVMPLYQVIRFANQAAERKQAVVITVEYKLDDHTYTRYTMQGKFRSSVNKNKQITFESINRKFLHFFNVEQILSIQNVA